MDKSITAHKFTSRQK